MTFDFFSWCFSCLTCNTTAAMSGTRSTYTVRVVGMPWPKTEKNHYHAQLNWDFSDKGRASKGLVVGEWTLYIAFQGVWNPKRHQAP